MANILGINFSGFVAWFLWRTIYLSKLPRLEKKVRVALDWTLDLLFSKYLVHLRKIGDAGDLGQHWLAPYAVLSMQQANLAK